MGIVGIVYLLTCFVDFHGKSMRIWDICRHLVDCDIKSVGRKYSSPIDLFSGDIFQRSHCASKFNPLYHPGGGLNNFHVQPYAEMIQIDKHVSNVLLLKWF